MLHDKGYAFFGVISNRNQSHEVRGGPTILSYVTFFEQLYLTYIIVLLITQQSARNYTRKRQKDITIQDD